MLFYGRKMGESDEQNGGWFNEKSLNYCKNYIVSDIHVHVQWKQQFKSVLDILLLCPGYWVNNRACMHCLKSEYRSLFVILFLIFIILHLF